MMLHMKNAFAVFGMTSSDYCCFPERSEGASSLISYLSDNY